MILRQCYNPLTPGPSEGLKKSAIPVILSAAKNLQLFVFKKINADASLRSA
jgi:hypothetical protein